MNLDLQIFSFLHSLAGVSFWLDFLLVFVSKYFLFLLGGVVGACLVYKREWRVLLWSGASVFFARGVVVEVIRYFYHRPRPFVAMDFQPLIEATRVVESFNHEASFPSGHTSIGFALATALYFYDKKLGVTLGLLALIVGISRVIVGVHYPSDILGGVVVGVLCGILIFRIFQKVKLDFLVDTTKKQP